MNFSTLVKRNLRHFWRTNLAVVLGVATAVAVLAGALLVGDSVRASLRDLALARLGKTDLAIVAAGFFRDQLAADLQTHEQFAAHFNGACPLIALAGAVTNDANNARAGDVQVYGVDERFWQFHDANVHTPADNDALVSQSLAAELGARPDDTLILRLEKPSAIPVESLHGRKEEVGVTVRFKMREALPLRSLGEFSLRPQQGGVRALFVPLQRLQRNIDQDDKANVLLLAAKQANGQAARVAERILKDEFTLADLGLKLRVLQEQRAIVLETDSAVISDAVAEKAKATAKALGLYSPSLFLTYLANKIRFNDKEIPYSLVTALDEYSLHELPGQTTEILQERTRTNLPGNHDWDLSHFDLPPKLVLYDWAARELGAKPGDEVTFEYYVWAEEGRLETKQAKFRVDAVVPMEGLAADRDLAPEYPGITEAKSLADWDPPFPIDLSRVRKVDEEYWDKYRTTPKAFLSLAAGQKLWATRYGKLTSIRVQVSDGADLENTRADYENKLRAALDPVQLGLSLQPVKEQSLQAARGATDFGEYFAYFSFFLVVSALLLTTLFFKLGIEQRLREIGLLRAVGYATQQIRSLFLREGLALAVVGSVVGLIGAILYGALMMWGLRTWWVGAVGTTLLELHVTPRSLLIGGLAGVVAALACVWWTLRSLQRISPRSLLVGTMENLRAASNGVQSTNFSWLFRRAKPPAKAGTLNAVFTSARMAVMFGILGLLLLAGAAFKLIGQVGGFFGAGTLLLVALLCFWSAWLRSDKKQMIAGPGMGSIWRLGFRNAATRPGRSVLCIALIAAASFIIVSVDAFRRDSGAAALDKNSGTGGYPLLAESLLPIVRDLNDAQGREELNLNDEALQGVAITRFRLRPGDDASCLNLYQPRNPRLLGAPADFIKQARFAFQSSLAQNDAERANPWLLLNQELDVAANQPPAIVPVIADANSLNYVLHLKLGDELTINTDDGRPVRLRVVAALADSILQGELLMAERNFLRLFPNEAGFRFFLIDAAPEHTTQAAALLEDKLSDFGFDATSTAGRLAEFHQVENTYLSTFQTLGGLGLLLGTFGLATVLLRNVLERRRELALLRAVGYQPSHLSLMVIAENALLLGCGLLTGVVCALLAIAPAFIARGGRLSAASLGLLLLAVLLTGLAASLVAVLTVIRSPLLPALRAE